MTKELLLKFKLGDPLTNQECRQLRETYVTAWGRDYTVEKLLKMTSLWQLQKVLWKVRTYNVYLGIILIYYKILVKVLRGINEFLCGIKVIWGK